MEYTEDQKAAFRAEFSARRKRQLAVSLPLAGAILAFALTAERADGAIFGISSELGVPVFLAVVAAGVLFSFRNWRCPACGRYLGRSVSPRHCQGCGVQLRG